MLVNPIGLEDWKAKGVPSLSVDQWRRARAEDRRRTASAPTSRSTYYAGQLAAGIRTLGADAGGHDRGPGKEIVARISALSTT